MNYHKLINIAEGRNVGVKVHNEHNTVTLYWEQHFKKTSVLLSIPAILATHNLLGDLIKTQRRLTKKQLKQSTTNEQPKTR